MEETKEDMANQKSGRQMTTYSAERELSLLTEYREVADTISIARFAREDDFYTLITRFKVSPSRILKFSSADV